MCYYIIIFAVLLYVQSLLYKNKDVCSCRKLGIGILIIECPGGGQVDIDSPLDYSLLFLDGLYENKSARIYSKRSMLLSVFRSFCFCGNFQGFQVHLFWMRKIKSARKISKSWCTQARAQPRHLSIQIQDSGLLNVDIQNAKQQYWSGDEGGCAIFFSENLFISVQQ